MVGLGQDTTSQNVGRDTMASLLELYTVSLPPPLPVLVNYRHWPIGFDIISVLLCMSFFASILWFSLDST